MLAKFVKIRAVNDEVLHLQDNVEAAINDIQKILAPLSSTRDTKTFDSNVVNEGEVALSNESGQFSTTSDTYVQVDNMVVALRTRGRPVMVGLIPGNPAVATYAYLEAVANAAAAVPNCEALYRITRDDVSIYSTILSYQESTAAGATKTMTVPPGTIIHIDTPPAGFHTYRLQAANAQPSANSITRVYNCRMFAYEL